VTAGEVRQAVRSQGIGGLELVQAVVLEADGSFSVIPGTQAGSGSASRIWTGMRSGGRDPVQRRLQVGAAAARPAQGRPVASAVQPSEPPSSGIDRTQVPVPRRWRAGG
jgi:hypothetical protein